MSCLDDEKLEFAKLLLCVDEARSCNGMQSRVVHRPCSTTSLDEQRRDASQFWLYCRRPAAPVNGTAALSLLHVRAPLSFSHIKIMRCSLPQCRGVVQFIDIAASLVYVRHKEIPSHKITTLATNVNLTPW